MHELQQRGSTTTDPRGPGRILRAAGLATIALIAAVASAQASSSSGGFGGGTGGATTACPDTELGQRTLRLGDCGGDVETLNWILSAKDYPDVPLVEEYEDPTAAAVREFQRDAGLVSTGVATVETTAALANAMPSQLATWYGPGFFGNETACGKLLTRRTRGVAHRTLPCGTKVVLRYDDRYVRTKVIDRGPFANGAKWDLTQATAKDLGFTATDEVRVAKLARPKPIGGAGGGVG